MDLLEGLATTRAIRRYTDQPVTDEELATILFAATRAPSGSNRQAFRFLVLRDGPRATVARRLLGDAARRMWMNKSAMDGYTEGSGTDPTSPKARMARTMVHYAEHFAEAPVIVLVCLVRYREANWFEGSSVYPAAQNLLLAARAIGLGGVLTGVQLLVEDDLRPALAIPDGVALHATITLGHPAGHHGPVRRRPVRELVYEDGWGEEAAWAVDPPGTRFAAAGPPRQK
ncbi:MAG TPA: nitroreductase family protein [Acidimicrobiales bacterium]|nr:nitroreductase family protein [Acidimicrobiales bacterium]